MICNDILYHNISKMLSGLTVPFVYLLRALLCLHGLEAGVEHPPGLKERGNKESQPFTPDNPVYFPSPLTQPALQDMLYLCVLILNETREYQPNKTLVHHLVHCLGPHI